MSQPPIQNIIIYLANILTDLFSLLLIYTILYKTPSRMAQIRPYLLGLAISSWLFSILWCWGIMPIAHIPLPFMEIHGFFRFFGSFAGHMAVMSTVVTFSLGLIFIFDITLMRMAIAYNLSSTSIGRLDKLFFTSIIWMTIAITLYSWLYLGSALGDKKATIAYANRHNLSLENVSFNEPFAFLILDSSSFKTTIMIIGILYFFFSIAVYPCSILTLKRIRSSVQQSEKYRKQLKNLTYMVMVQAILPMLVIIVPEVYILISFFYYPSATENLGISWMLFNFFLSFLPIVENLASVFFVAPYRQFIMKVLLRTTKKSQIISAKSGTFIIK